MALRKTPRSIHIDAVGAMVPEFRTSPVWVKLTLSKETTAKSKAFLDLCACFVQKHEATITQKDQTEKQRTASPRSSRNERACSLRA